MATQWQGGLTAYSKLPAATLNTIGAVWETWTPTITATAGAITSGTLNLARYARFQKLVFADLTYLVNTAGTAAGASLITTLPVTPLAAYPVGQFMGAGREYAAVGFTVQGLLVAPTVRVVDYLGAGWIQNGRGISVTFIYEAA